MKKVLLTIAAVGFTVAAFGQGAVVIDNITSDGGPTIDNNSTFYGGVFGLEVWFKNGSAVNTAINSLNGAPNGAPQAYGLLATDGFTKVTTLANRSNVGNDGVIQLGQLNIPGVTPAGSSVTLALVMWNSAAADFSTFLGSAGLTGRAGVYNFVNPTADYTAVPTPITPALSGWTQNLVMTVVPEPTSFALCGLGAAAMLIFRRRK